MQKVVDSNFLQRQELRTYFAKSNRNFVVLNDYAAMEAYKGKTLTSIYRSMEILSEYPKQIIVLKDTQTICALRGRRAGLQRRMIDEAQTRQFSQYCRSLAVAKQGEPRFQRSLLRLGAEASAHMARLMIDAEKMAGHFDAIAQTLTTEEVRRLRTGYQPIEALSIDKLIKNIMLVAGFLFRDHPKVTKLPTWGEAPNTFIFRSSICMFLWVLRWISVGGASGAKPEKIRNDMVDINFAAYATFFDGLLTEDKKLAKLHRDTVRLLRQILARSA